MALKSTSIFTKKTGLALTLAMSLSLAACGAKDDAAGTAADKGSAVKTASEAKPGAASPVTAMSLAAGPDVCFAAITKHLGPEAKVSEITSFFSAGKEIDSSDDEPQGQMTTCTVDYQNPADPRKMLQTRLDIATGQFSAPSPVEITVMGNAADFKLDDYVIALSALNPAALTSVMDAQKAKLSTVYGKYAWTGVRLSAPDAFSEKHTLRLDIDGRLASNDIQNSGYASVSVDGTTITTNNLMP
jgi:hypothetical protein